MPVYRSGGDVQKYAVKGFISFFLLHGFSMTFGLLLNYLLIKLVGTADYGAYVYIMNFMALLSGLCILGTDVLVLRKNEIFYSAGKFGQLKGVILFSVFISLLTTLLAGAILALFAGKYKDLYHLGTYEYLAICLLMLPLISLVTILQGSLQGLKRIVYSQLPDKIIRPLIFILVAGVFFALGKGASLSDLVVANTAILCVVFIIAAILQLRMLPAGIRQVQAVFEFRPWMRLSLSFFLLNVLSILSSRIDIFLLGIFRSQADVGVYNIVLRLSELSGFGLFAINFVIAPVVARLIAEKNTVALQKLITGSVRLAFAISLPVIVCLVLFSGFLLNLFHVDSPDARAALIILSCGQLVNVLTGSVGLLLLMSDNQYYSILGLAISIVVSIILNIVLTPVYGIVGVSIAAATGLVLWNLIMYFFARRKLFINTTPFGTF